MQGRDGSLSFATLVIASLSSAAAALLTSLFWESGTVAAAAFTPVIVSIVSEALKKPATRISQVRTVRREQTMGGDSTAGSAGAGAGAENGSTARATRRPRGGTATAERPTVTASVGGEGGAGPGGPRFGRRRLNVRLALITGGLAFLIAAAFLTLPELIAGQSVVGQPGRTTLGGGSSVDTSGEDTEAAPAQDGGGAGQEPASGDPEAEPAPSESTAPEAGGAGAEEETPSEAPTSPEPSQQQRGTPESGGSPAPSEPESSQPAEPQQP